MRRKTNAVGGVLRRVGKVLLHRVIGVKIRSTSFPVDQISRRRP